MHASKCPHLTAAYPHFKQLFWFLSLHSKSIAKIVLSLLSHSSWMALGSPVRTRVFNAARTAAGSVSVAFCRMGSRRRCGGGGLCFRTGLLGGCCVLVGGFRWIWNKEESVEGEEGEIPRFYHFEKSTNGIEPRDGVCATCPCVGDNDDWPGEHEEFFEGLEVVSSWSFILTLPL